MNKKNLNKKGKIVIDNHLKNTIKQLNKLKKEARTLGIFVDDRNLLKCPECGLMEDIDSNGMLLTVFEKFPNKDTGLRFKEIKNGKIFRCPNCGQKLSENVAKILGEK